MKDVKISLSYKSVRISTVHLGIAKQQAQVKTAL